MTQAASVIICFISSVIYTISSLSSVILYLDFASLYITSCPSRLASLVFLISCIVSSRHCFLGIRFIFSVVSQIFCYSTALPFLKLSLFSFTAFCTSSFHHQDSLSTYMYLPTHVSPNSSLALVLISCQTSHVVSSSSFFLPICSASLSYSSYLFLLLLF